MDPQKIFDLLNMQMSGAGQKPGYRLLRQQNTSFLEIYLFPEQMKTPHYNYRDSEAKDFAEKYITALQENMELPKGMALQRYSDCMKLDEENGKCQVITLAIEKTDNAALGTDDPALQQQALKAFTEAHKKAAEAILSPTIHGLDGVPQVTMPKPRPLSRGW